MGRKPVPCGTPSRQMALKKSAGLQWLHRIVYCGSTKNTDKDTKKLATARSPGRVTRASRSKSSLRPSDSRGIFRHKLIGSGDKGQGE
ncbi:hypothetical protein J6590_021479 [Homalodisca vitripennis]|nr:hypothetical protein J6590_021479 [Homalodisca vitripennis]